MRIQILPFVCCLLGWHLASAQRSYFIQLGSIQPPLLEAFAGDDIIWNDDMPTLGGNPTASGGLMPYNYQCNPLVLLDNPNSANHIFLGPENTTYIIRVSDSRGCYSKDTVIVTVSGINETGDAKDFRAYPNPATQEIQVIAPRNLDFQHAVLQLFDGAGRLVLEENWNSNASEFLLDIRQIEAGNYLMVVSDGKLRSSKKIVIH
jgi:hypothetical protein